MDGNRLIVEGDEDKRVIPELIERAGVVWGLRGAEVVKIHSLDGFRNLTSGEFNLQLKTAGLRRLGLLVDADEDPTARWQAVRGIVGGAFALPAEPIPAGVVVPANAPATPRFGVWLMPDNTTRGMLETFLLALRPTNEPDLHAHVEASTDEAKRRSAPFSLIHRDKALIHTWLAWREPPGRQLHQAILERMLDPNATFAAAFVSWFRALFEL